MGSCKCKSKSSLKWSRPNGKSVSLQQVKGSIWDCKREGITSEVEGKGGTPSGSGIPIPFIETVLNPQKLEFSC